MNKRRLPKEQRRIEIINAARILFLSKGFGMTEMENIRAYCELSRGGLYHHFGNKLAVLDALVDIEVTDLVIKIQDGQGINPIQILLQAGSSHFGEQDSLLAAFTTREERAVYLSSLDRAFAEILRSPLAIDLAKFTKAGVNEFHVAELFICVNSLINRRELLDGWSRQESKSFAVMALTGLKPFLKKDVEFELFLNGLYEVKK